MKTLITVLVLSLSLNFAWAQQKTVITKAEDLPKHSYELKNKDALAIIQSKDKTLELALLVKKDLLDDLEKYDIRENATLREYYGNLLTISLIEEDFQKALDYIYMRRELADKASDKLLLGIGTEAFIKTSEAQETKDANKISPEITQWLIEKVDSYDFEVIQEDLESAKGRYEIWSENLIIGIVQSQVQPALDNNAGPVPGDLVMSLIGYNSFFNYTLPYKDAFHEAYATVLDKNIEKVEKTDIWKEREVVINNEGKNAPVLIGIWDTGVDVPVLPQKHQWHNEKEKLDGQDTDGNGFVDDVYGIAYDLEDFKDPNYLNPLAHNLKDKKTYQDNLKGLMDLQANINSEESSRIKKHLAQLQPEEVKGFIENLNLYSGYAHGTHVAGIAAAGNDGARILSVRFTPDHKSIPDPITEEGVARSVKNFADIVNYLEENKVQIVNMSWGGTYEGFVANLEVNGIGKDDKERKALAKSYFTRSYDAFKKALESAPEILFVCAAGNSNDDVDFAGSYPSSINLPNLITVGAVDIEGKKAGFTTEGASVDVYANGYEVMSYVPGGDRIALSGTSMASPNVANLAGKILAVNPVLKPAQVIDIIVKTSTKSEEDEKVLLIHPKAAIELASK